MSTTEFRNAMQCCKYYKERYENGDFEVKNNANTLGMLQNMEAERFEVQYRDNDKKLWFALAMLQIPFKYEAKGKAKNHNYNY